MTHAAGRPDTSEFNCPFFGPCLTDMRTAFSSYEECNVAVGEYARAIDPDERARVALDLYRRLLPLVRKSLRRFCPPHRLESRCQPGVCLPEDLVGESYLAFQELLDRYDPGKGTDFVGYAAQRFYWSLEHRARPLVRATSETAVGELEDIVERDDEEERLFCSIFAGDLLADLRPAEAEVIMRDVAGHTSEEIAHEMGISPSAVRKRIERIRHKLRVIASED